ncbi:GyrI-like domain-containing protein [Candidatus Stoquefichus massiliensis]|uniref:GyrI-like domain-containing protein n=1 Tax=Candidatus Stoquefichus massiliensis TaxID=1470350 RepID=UPI00048005A9|nr:GyrI-like domain-containing protein [Candidatus Stoquefichus massiliensis]
MNKLDYKKAYKDIYMPATKPTLIDLPTIQYVCVDGKGNPNTSQEYKEAIGILYAISYAIKMSPRKGTEPDGYFEYVVPPLEGLWFGEEGYFDGTCIIDKDKFHWRSMIRLPEFVTRDYFEQVKAHVSLQKPELNVNKAIFLEYDEGLCVQIMHKGSYDEEPASVMKINQFIEEHDLLIDINDTRLHHEIYLSDPRKSKVDNLKTVIRHPVKRKV